MRGHSSLFSTSALLLSFSNTDICQTWYRRSSEVQRGATAGEEADAETDGDRGRQKRDSGGSG